MTNFRILLLCLVVLQSCGSLESKQIKTAKKVHYLLDEGKSENLNRLLVNGNSAGRDTERITFESKIYQKIIDKYGTPDFSHCNYIVDKNDFIYPYKVDFPIFIGQDTVVNYKVENSVCLRVLFGPEQINNPSKIADYEIVIDDEAYPFSPQKRIQDSTAIEEFRDSYLKSLENYLK
ncbi:hypothetical protein [Mangrovibacterium diazotrophicum]|uniref:Lipoprotein n=1 Tax=Mangrovibacterium diazotrophicum TaxID=1261403 RepID=A0A419VW68_9BACT|nr:hypothetical protein [Mangrovibacterium diazotrophicum]RKD86400.1 hypothetical protein BC643_4091 [Mangrovibacterium diazotrophicum]